MEYEYPKPPPRAKKEFQPLRRKPIKIKAQPANPDWKQSGNFYVLKSGKPIRKVSAKLAKVEAEKAKMYAELEKTRPAICAGCGTSQALSRSHRISQSNWAWKADPDNIDLFCINGQGCHQNYEAGYLWRLDNGNEVLIWLRDNSWSHYAAKVMQMKDQIFENSLILEEMPSWVSNHINSL